MSADLEISLRPKRKRKEEIIDFYFAQNWDQNSEQQLLYRLQEILCLTRSYGEKLSLTLVVEVRDPGRVRLLLKKFLAGKISQVSSQLSIRELEVMNLLMQGLTNKEIACRLFISYETVKSHRKNILQKTNCKNTAALISYYHTTFFDK
ncbi:response regulator transcription factor [Salinimicrobium sp. TH3]|uniref:response regulator transcription factor n=1 Tax=Salinimicrobium sp. TH3 TaxID=2997342 RepID=UPI0022736C1B|nr:helix-turn-helix transcriptional regulator [Salinimicrobium sp. TH3]MCY2687584.1 helix-turn-helix transcriptional regulator [Salinimicrobium sp. TH3]